VAAAGYQTTPAADRVLSACRWMPVGEVRLIAKNKPMTRNNARIVAKYLRQAGWSGIGRHNAIKAALGVLRDRMDALRHRPAASAGFIGRRGSRADRSGGGLPSVMSGRVFVRSAMIGWASVR
jgi:hypothetical protein